MIVFAHAGHWFEAAVLAMPAAIVVASIARSIRARRSPLSHGHEEVTR